MRMQETVGMWVLQDLPGVLGCCRAFLAAGLMAKVGLRL